MNRELKFEQKVYLKAGRNEVWDALVNPEKIKKYLFGTNTVCDWKEGSTIVFEGEHEGTKYRDSGVIKEFIVGKNLAYTYWSSFSTLENTPENHSFIRFSLSDFAEGTELVMCQEGFASLEAQKHSQSSWDMVLNSLKDIVENE